MHTLFSLTSALSVFLLLLVPFFSACGDSGSACGEGNDGVPNIIDEDDNFDSFWIGRLAVSDMNVLSGSDPNHVTQVQAFFRDMVDYQVELAARQEDFTTACFIYTSLPVTTGEQHELTASKVTVGGLVGGDLVMEPVGEPPRIGVEILPGRAFLDDTVRFQVESGVGATDFPAFQDTLATPDPVVLTQLGDLTNPDLTSRPSIGIDLLRQDPLQVQWEAGNGDVIEFKLIPGEGSDTPYGKLRCITFDDGCLEVPAAAINYLSADMAINFQLKIERQNYALHSVVENGETKGVAIVSVSSVLEGTVLR